MFFSFFFLDKYSMSIKKITFEITSDNIFNNVTEHNEKYLNEDHAEAILDAIKQDVEDWFNTSIDAIIVNATNKVIDDIMNPQPMVDDHDVYYGLRN